MNALSNALRSFYLFFRDGFGSMTIGRTLWAIVLIKLFIMFAILRVFFFPNFLNSNFESDDQKSDYVRMELIERGTQY